jgi:hypothetical protein
VAGSCERGDEPSGSGAKELVHVARVREMCIKFQIKNPRDQAPWDIHAWKAEWYKNLERGTYVINKRLPEIELVADSVVVNFCKQRRESWVLLK